jgi:hypothetical protein
LAPPYATALELVEALQARLPGAREQLRAWLAEPLAGFVDRLIARHDLPHARDLLVRHSLSALEMYLRTRRADEFAAMTLRTFQATLLVHVGKLVRAPFGRDGARGMAPDLLPEAVGYEGRALNRPAEHVGGFWFRGDWYGGAAGDDGSLWLFLADVSGPGYPASLVAGHLPHAWRACWDRAGGGRPVELVAALHDVLKDCLPEGVYIEASLTRFGPDGEVSMAPAGGCRALLRRRGQAPAALHTVGGPWLGRSPPSGADQYDWFLHAGDELLLATDGLFDQFGDPGGSASRLPTLLAGAAPEAPLMETVSRLVEQALQDGPPRDDITAVTFCRRTPAWGPPHSRRLVLLPEMAAPESDSL